MMTKTHKSRKKLIIICCLILFKSTASFTQPIASAAKWHGFEKFAFSFEGKNAYLVKPVKSLPGNPWVWRAYFPDWHYEMDSILVSEGFHIAFIDCSDMFGNPASMQIWEKFYLHLISNYSFSRKPVLEGVSRGGLYIYNWAKRNPDKVSFIYAEAPVLDIKSWPGGKGGGFGSREDWKKCLSAYGFSEEQAIAFSENPIDNIESLASYKVPAIHVVCSSDSIVPVEENTGVMQKRFLLAGGNISVDTMIGNVRLNGHHFDIKTPGYYAALIIKKILPVKNWLWSDAYIEPNGGLNNSLSKIINQKELTVAFLGGSITYNHGWRNMLCRYLQEVYPATKFRFVAAGVPSLGSLPHAFRLQSDVLDKGKIDLLFIESAVNDCANGTNMETQYRAIEGIIRHALASNPSMNLVLMAFADEDKNKKYALNLEPDEVKVHREMAKHYALPFVNLSKEVFARINNGEFTWKDDFKDLHPSAFGQNIYFQALKTLLHASVKAYRQEPMVDAKLPPTRNKGVYEKGKYVNIYEATRLNGFSIVDKWKPADQKETRDGFVNVPVLEATKAGSSFSLFFEGDAVGIAIVSGPDAGVIEYRIDNGKTHSVNLVTKWSNSLHLPWYLMLYDGLKEGKHQLEVRISSAKRNSGGTACRIVNFLVNK